MSTTDCVCVLRGEEVGYIILAQSVKESRVSSFLKRICAYRKSNSSSLGNEIYLNRWTDFLCAETAYHQRRFSQPCGFLPNSLSVDYQRNEPKIQFQCQLNLSSKIIIIIKKKKCAVLPWWWNITPILFDELSGWEKKTNRNMGWWVGRVRKNICPSPITATRTAWPLVSFGTRLVTHPAFSLPFARDPTSLRLLFYIVDTQGDCLSLSTDGPILCVCVCVAQFDLRPIFFKKDDCLNATAVCYWRIALDNLFRLDSFRYRPWDWSLPLYPIGFEFAVFNWSSDGQIEGTFLVVLFVFYFLFVCELDKYYADATDLNLGAHPFWRRKKKQKKKQSWNRLKLREIVAIYLSPEWQSIVHHDDEFILNHRLEHQLALLAPPPIRFIPR